MKKKIRIFALLLVVAMLLSAFAYAFEVCTGTPFPEPHILCG